MVIAPAVVPACKPICVAPVGNTAWGGIDQLKHALSIGNGDTGNGNGAGPRISHRERLSTGLAHLHGTENHGARGQYGHRRRAAIGKGQFRTETRSGERENVTPYGQSAIELSGLSRRKGQSKRDLVIRIHRYREKGRSIADREGAGSINR